jgi:uncharacterized protein YrrD
MFTGQSLIGRRVLARQEGQMLDSVKDVVIDTAQRRVVALLVSEGRLFGSPTVIPLDKVVSIGDDVVVVADVASAVPADQYPTVKQILDRDDHLVGKNVFTENGSEFGRVVDVTFDLPQGDIGQIKIAARSDDKDQQATMDVAISDVVSIGPDAVVISRNVALPAAGLAPLSAAQGPLAADSPPTSSLAPDADEGSGGWTARRSAGDTPGVTGGSKDGGGAVGK